MNGYSGTPLPPLQPCSVLTALGTGRRPQQSARVPSSGLDSIPGDQTVGIHLPQPAAALGLAGVPVLQRRASPGPPVTTVSPQPVLQKPPYWSGCSDWSQGLGCDVCPCDSRQVLGSFEPMFLVCDTILT